MRKMRTLLVGVAALALVAAASAQFDGPAPLAWRWLQPTRVPPSGAPLVQADTVYTAVGGRVFCLDLPTGNLKWKFPAVEGIDGAFRSAPIYFHTVAEGASPEIKLLVAAGDNKLVYAVDPETGDSKWSCVLPGSPIGQPTQVGHLVVIALSDNHLVAIDPTNGSLAWKAPYNIYAGLVGQIGAFGSNVLYFTGDNQLVSLNVDTLKTTWRQRFEQLPAQPTPQVLGESVYLSTGGFLASINAVTGAARWEKKTGLELKFSPAASASGVLVVSEDGHALIFSIDGTLVTKKAIELGSAPVVQPAAVGTKFLAPTSNGAINLVDSKDGAILWSYLVRPLAEAASSSSNGSMGGFPGMGGMGGGQRGMGPMGGGQRGNSSSTKEDAPTTVQASGPAVLAGQTLLVPERDGSILAFDKDLGIDLTPPEVKMVWPNRGDQVSGQPPLQLMFKIMDEASGVNEKTLKIQIDDQDVDFKYGRDGYATVVFSTLGKNKPLSDGRKDISVTVSDWLGNEIVQHYSLSIDNTLKPLALPGSDTTNKNGGFPGMGGPGGKGGGGRGGFGGGE